MRSSRAAKRISSRRETSPGAKASAKSASGAPRHSERLRQAFRCGTLGIARAQGLAALVGQAPEALEIELLGIELEDVTGRAGDEKLAGLAARAVGLQHLAKLGDMDLKRLGRGLRRGAAPELIDQPVGGHDLVRVQKQDREQAALLLPSQGTDLPFSWTSSGPRMRNSTLSLVKRRLYRRFTANAARALTAVSEARRNEIAAGGLRRKGTTHDAHQRTPGLAHHRPRHSLRGNPGTGVRWVRVGERDRRLEPVERRGSLGLESVNAITGPVQTSDDRGYESINAVTGPVGDQPSSQVIRADRYSSPNALVGAQPTPTSLVEVRESSGFDWGDAMIGALVGTALMLLAFGGARLIGRSGRRTAESSA